MMNLAEQNPSDVSQQSSRVMSVSVAKIPVPNGETEKDALERNQITKKHTIPRRDSRVSRSPSPGESDGLLAPVQPELPSSRNLFP